MKRHIAHTTLFLLLVIITGSCSTKKNTWTTRAYQDINTRFNVYFNGTISYNEGLKNIHKANVDDYSSVIPMYPVSKHSNAATATSNMDRTIEKSRKAIKLHSIKVKPEKNARKANDPKYKLFYNQEEFNPALKEAWLLLGKAEFHKADFLGAVGTFSYIARHYPTDKDMVARCQLWIARAYAEMGWIYEAEQVLSKLEQDNLKRSNIGLFAAVNADLLLKKHQYKEAIPFLELALSKENDKDLKERFSFVLAQLYQKAGNNRAAYTAFSKVIKMNPPFEMDFYARINRTQLQLGNPADVRKELRKMLKNPNNKDYLDQLYFALGNTYLQKADTAKAIENYKLATENSTRNGNDKAQALITLGDIYYAKRNYVLAQPCYDEAGKILPNENGDYARVTRRGEMLSELVMQYEIVVLQDSLQRLAAMPESKRLEVVNNIIDKIIAEEKLAAENAQKESQNQNFRGNEDFANMPPIGMNTLQGTGDWYFYNPNLIRNGQTEFQKKWGKRKLEDNWRRTNKATSLFVEDIAQPVDQQQFVEGQPESSETPDAAVPDNKKPAFYLKQIPVTPAQLKKSDADIASALFAMGLVYKDKIEDIPMAISTFDEFIRRFGNDERVPDAYFQMYIMETRAGNTPQANLYRNRLITEFPGSKYEKILSQPDYSSRLERMYQEQDSIYNLTYKAYNSNDFQTVYRNVDYIQKNYPLSTLMPKFLFLNALSIGKRESPEKFRTALNNLVTDYPASDVSAMAKDILALIKQGQEAKTGTTSGSLLTRREATMKTEIEEMRPAKSFSPERQTKHRVLLISPDSMTTMNKLLYNVASFNFSRFLIKDFDLVINKVGNDQNALSVTNLESYEEAKWYLNSIATDATISGLLNQLNARRVIISEENYALLRTGFSLDEYLAFEKQPVQAKPVVQVALNSRQAKKPETVLPAAKDNKAVNTTVNTPAKTTDAAIEKNPVNNQPATTPSEKPAEKAAEKPAQTTPEKEKQVAAANKPVTNKPAETTPAKATETVTPPAPKEEAVPLFKNLFAYRANEPHYVAIYVLSGNVNFDQVKAAFDAYNAKNYSIMNLNVSLEKLDKIQVIIIGSLSDAQVAKSYLLRMVKEQSLFDGLKGANYRNLVGSQKNLNTVIQQNALNTYFEFMQEYYLK